MQLSLIIHKKSDNSSLIKACISTLEKLNAKIQEQSANNVEAWIGNDSFLDFDNCPSFSWNIVCSIEDDDKGNKRNAKLNVLITNPGSTFFNGEARKICYYYREIFKEIFEKEYLSEKPRSKVK